MKKGGKLPLFLPPYVTLCSDYFIWTLGIIVIMQRLDYCQYSDLVNPRRVINQIPLCISWNPCTTYSWLIISSSN